MVFSSSAHENITSKMATTTGKINVNHRMDECKCIVLIYLQSSARTSHVASAIEICTLASASLKTVLRHFVSCLHTAAYSKASVLDFSCPFSCNPSSVICNLKKNIVMFILTNKCIDGTILLKLLF